MRCKPFLNYLQCLSFSSVGESDQVESLPEAFPRWCVVFCGGKISCPSDNMNRRLLLVCFMIHVHGKTWNVFDRSTISGSYEVVTRRTWNVNESEVFQAPVFSYFLLLSVNARGSSSVGQRLLERLPTEASVDEATGCWEWQESLR